MEGNIDKWLWNPKWKIGIIEASYHSHINLRYIITFLTKDSKSSKHYLDKHLHFSPDADDAFCKWLHISPQRWFLWNFCIICLPTRSISGHGKLRITSKSNINGTTEKYRNRIIISIQYDSSEKWDLRQVNDRHKLFYSRYD